MTTPPPSVLEDLQRWTDEVKRNEERPITLEEEAEYVAVTDASKQGWGAVVMHIPTGHTSCYSHEWEESFERRGYSTAAEPEAIYRLLCRMLPALRKTTIKVFTDSTTAKAALPKGYSPAFHVNTIAQRIRSAFPHVTLLTEHVPGKQNCSDGLSRGETMTAEDWTNFRGILGRAGVTPQLASPLPH